MTTYDDPRKRLAWQGYWRGYQLGKNVETMDELDKRAARSQFEHWWRLNNHAEAGNE